MQLHRIPPFGGPATRRPVAQQRSARSTGARPCRARCVVVQASAKADTLLAQARERYEAGDRMTAMKYYEQVLKEDPTVEQLRASLYGSTAVHAAFGDVELAQMTLREAMRNGLDYEAALEDPANVQMVTSLQITIQLRKFSQQVQNAMANRAPSERPYGKGKAASSTGRRPAAGQDLDSILGSATSDEAQVDTSIPGIIRRVAILLLVGSGLGVGLWFLGLEYLFPKGI